MAGGPIGTEYLGAHSALRHRALCRWTFEQGCHTTNADGCLMQFYCSKYCHTKIKLELHFHSKKIYISLHIKTHHRVLFLIAVHYCIVT